MSDTVTVTIRRRGAAVRYYSEFSRLPGHVFGPYNFAGIIRDLPVSAFLTPLEARNLVIDATINGIATAETR